MTPEEAWEDIEAWQKSQGAVQGGNGDLDLRASRFGRVLEYVSDTDRKWFEEHPGETFYVRDAIEGEWPPKPEGVKKIQVLVTFVRPGMRTRKPIFLT